MLADQKWINKLALHGLRSDPIRNALIISSAALLISFATVVFSVALGMVQNAERPDYMLYTFREMMAPFHLMGLNAWGPWLNPVFILLPVLLCSFLLIDQCFAMAMQKDIRMYALMMISGLTSKQQSSLAMRQGIILWFCGVLAGLPVSFLVSAAAFLAYGQPMYQSEKAIALFWSPAAFFISCMIALPVILLGASRAYYSLREVSPAEAIRFGAAPLRLSPREAFVRVLGDAARSVKTSTRSWYIWNRFKGTKEYYLSFEGRRQAVLEAKKKQHQKQILDSKISVSYAKLMQMSLMNALRSIKHNYFVILSLCTAILIFALINHLTFGLDPKVYTDVELENHDFVLINATCRTDYYDPDPPLIGGPVPQHVFSDRILEEIQAREGVTVSITEVVPGSELNERLLKVISEPMIYKVNIDTDQTHFLEVETYLSDKFKGNYQVWIQNRALTAFQVKMQVTAAYMLGSLLAAVIALTGILGFINTSAISINARKGELAMLRSVGMTGGQLRRMLLLEGFLYALIITVLTAPVLIPTSAPIMCISVYAVIALLLTFIPYMVYAPEKKKSVSKMLQEVF